LDISNLITAEEVNFFYEKLNKYYAIINRNLSDTVPKVVAGNMIHTYYGNLEKFFQDAISENLESLTLLEEDPNIERRRESLKDTLEKLRKSNKILQTFSF